MRSRVAHTIAFVASLTLIGCSGGAKTEKGDSVAAEAEKPAAEAEVAAAEAKPELAPCTALADVPQDATNCLLDLGAGKDTYWNDSDGVDPATAGCHYEFSDATCGENVPDRTFGEASDSG